MEVTILTKSLKIGNIHEIESGISRKSIKIKITKIISARTNKHGTIIAEILAKEVT